MKLRHIGALALFFCAYFSHAQVQLGKGVQIGAGSGGGSAPAGPGHAVQAANAGVTGPEADQNVRLDTTNHQHVITGIGSALQTSTNPSAGYGSTWNNSYTTKLNAPIDFARTAYFGGPGGINYGNGPFVTGNLWTSSGFNFWNVTFARRGITQAHSGQVNKYSTGDYSWDYANGVFSPGGITGASDEGGNGSKIIGGESPGWFAGTTATTTTGATTLALSSGQTCDGCFIYDASKPSTSGHVSGITATVTLGSTTYFSVPVDTAVTPSKAFAVPVCDMPELTDQTVPQTVSCTVSGIQGSTGAFTTGIASLSGSYAEQVGIVAGTLSGGAQTLQVTYRNPHASGTAILWQGGTAQGQIYSNTFMAGVSGQPNGFTVFGAPDANHLAMGVAFGGTQVQPSTNYVAPIALGAVTITGGVATATVISGNIAAFDNLASATISGSSGCNGTLDGAASSVSLGVGVVSWTTAGTATSCTSTNINYVAAVFSYTLYPYAEQIAAGDVNGVAQVEPNIVPFTNGDSIVQPHPPTFGYTSRWDDVQIHNPFGYANSVGIIQTFTGAGISGNFNFFRLVNQNPCSMFAGCGGKLTMQPWIQLEGVNYGTIRSNLPIVTGVFAMQFSCALGYNCANRDDALLLSVKGSMYISHLDGFFHTSNGIATDNGSVRGIGLVSEDNSASAASLQSGDLLTAVYNFNGADNHCFSAYTSGGTLAPSGGLCFGIHGGNVNHVILQVDNPSAPGSGSTALATGMWDGFGTPTLDLLSGATIGTKNVCLADGTNCPASSGYTSVAGNIPKASNTTGTLVDSGIAANGIGLLGGNQSWTNLNQWLLPGTFLGQLNVAQPNPATSSANFPATSFVSSSAYWTGTTSSADTWVWTPVLGTGANPTTVYTLSHGGSTGAASLAIPFPINITTLAATTNNTQAASTGYVKSITGMSNTATAAVGSGVTSVTCASATCTSTRGTYTVVGGTATTGTIATLTWTATSTIYVCQVSQNGGTSFFGLGHGAATTTGLVVTAANTVNGATFGFDYECIP